MSAKAEELLPGIVRFMRERGPDAFVLGNIAEELGTSSRMLIYHFGGRDELLGRAMRHVRELTITELESPPPTTLVDAIDSWWAYYMEHPSDMQLFFHLASRRFESPEQFEEFASTAVDSWIRYFANSIEAEGHDPERATVFARLVLATLRGLVVDFLVSGDREHVEDSLNAFRDLLTAVLTSRSARTS